MLAECLICNRRVPEYTWNNSGQGARVECEVCGTYRASEKFSHKLLEFGFFPRMPLEVGYPFSGVIREHHEKDVELFIHDLEQLTALVRIKNDPLESIDQILLYVYYKSESASGYVYFDEEVDYAIAYAKGPEEFEYFLEKAEELGYLETTDTMAPDYRLALDGWKRVAELRRNQSDSRQAFVAMWFHKDMEQVFEQGFKPALEATGYRAFRVDMSEHNDKIDDRIIAEIRRSGLLVADFTGQRGGVYFEAGFAMGLGIPVIWACREDHIGGLHFDTRQYNHIAWVTPEDLMEKLKYRIEATLPNRLPQGQ